MTDDEIISNVLAVEKGWANRRNDRGGPTMRGITLGTLAEARGRAVTIDELKALTEADAREIYRRLYIMKPGFDAIAHPALRELVIDSGVNSGQSRAAKWLQAALGLKADGVIGPKTRDALVHVEVRSVYLRVLELRIRHLGRLITDDPTQAENAAGWTNRVGRFVATAP